MDLQLNDGGQDPGATPSLPWVSIHLRWVHWYFLAFTVAVLVVEGSAAHVAGDVLVANAVALAAATMLMYLMQRTLMSSVRASARESDRTRRILETATDAYIEMSDTGRVTEWNDQAEATFGWSRAEAVGQLVTELIIPLELRAAHLAGVTRILDTGASGPLRRTSEVPARHRDGTELTVEISTWVTADGDRRRFNALLQDISAASGPKGSCARPVTASNRLSTTPRSGCRWLMSTARWWK